MKLVNLLALTYGELINKPFISSFTNITFDAKKVKRGDLFVAFDVVDIQEAIFNGAYGIVFDKPTQITDTEIAWIKVKQSSDALRRLLRFRLIEKEVESYQLNEVEFRLAQEIESDNSLLCVEGEIQQLWKSLWEVDDKTKLFFCPTLTDVEIFTDIKQLPTRADSKMQVVEKTLFETSFIYDDIFYANQHLPTLFLPYLENILSFYKEQKIRFRIKKINFIKNFQPQFVNKYLEPKEFGESESVLVFEHNKQFVKDEIAYLQKNATWAKKIYFIPHYLEKEYAGKESVVFYKTYRTIVSQLKKRSFHFALIVDAKEDDIVQKPKQQTQLLLDF